MTPLRVGRYLVFEEIAAGGMATVHYGRLLGEAGFSRTVAIKRLHESFAKDPDFIAMFIDEARLAARIQHPNVVTTLDVVQSEGALVLVMEYLHGETLSRLLRCAQRDGEDVPLDIASAIICDALHGLHAAHEATAESGEPLHLVHRDVSPQNLLVGAEGITRVVDFGVAKAIGRIQTTQEGQIKGKIAYMAPEQLLGDPIDRRADVYATGVVLWELLTHQPLFASDSPAGTLQRALNHTPALPSSFDPRIPAALDALVMRALSRDPAARFATARDMAQALEASTGVASARRIAEWVEALAGDRLTKRRRRLAEIERMPALPEPSAVATNAEGLAADALTIVLPRPSDVSSARRWPVAVGVLTIAAVAFLGVGVAVSSSSPAVEAPRAPGATSAPSAAPDPSPAESAGATPPTASPEALAPAPSAASSAAAAPRPLRKADAKAVPRRCATRTFVDKDGIVRFQRDCEK